MAEPDVIVMGQHSNVGPGTIVYNTYNNIPREIPTLSGYDDSDPTNDQVSVTIRIDDPAHASDSLLAAKNVIAAISRIADAAKANPNVIIEFPDGLRVDGAHILRVISEIKFVITDKSYNSVISGGLGGSDFAAKTDYLNYQGFMPGQQWGAYGDAGMNGIMLHEIGHLTAIGHDNLIKEDYWRGQEQAEAHAPIPMANSDYAYDNEAYMDDFAINALNAFQLNSSVYAGAAQYDGTYQGGYTIYQNHGGSSIVVDNDPSESLAFQDASSAFYSNGTSNFVADFSDYAVYQHPMMDRMQADELFIV